MYFDPSCTLGPRCSVVILVYSELAIFTAFQPQLGLQLKRQKSTVQLLLIDHAKKPAEN
jgi:uncharacterized protein (TIGR03435 family)